MVSCFVCFVGGFVVSCGFGFSGFGVLLCFDVLLCVIVVLV